MSVQCFTFFKNCRLANLERIAQYVYQYLTERQRSSTVYNNLDSFKLLTLIIVEIF